MGIPGSRAPHSLPLCCIHAVDSGPFPRFALLTPSFSTQPLQALPDSCLRQGCPGLIPEEDLGWTALRTMELTWAEEALVWRAGEPVQMDALPSDLRGWSQWVGKGVAMVAHSLRTTQQWHLSSYGVPGFFLKLSLFWSSLLLSLQAVFFTANICPLPGFMLQTPLSRTQPPLAMRHTTQARVCRAEAQTMSTVLTLSCLSQTVHCVLLWSHKCPFMSQLISPPWRGCFSECGNFSPSASYKGCWYLFWFFFSFFLSFILPGCEGIFLVFLGVQIFC